MLLRDSGNLVFAATVDVGHCDSERAGAVCRSRCTPRSDQPEVVVQLAAEGIAGLKSRQDAAMECGRCGRSS